MSIQPSPLDFKVFSRPVFYTGTNGQQFPTDNKALVRCDAGTGDVPVCLSVVGKGYHVVQNDELFTAIDAGINGRRVEISDDTAHQGKTCIRTYTMPDVSFVSPDGKDIAFRVIAVNGFGSTAVKVYAGAIDFFCMNGMVLGSFVSAYARHSSGIQLQGFTKQIDLAQTEFWRTEETIERRVGTKVNLGNVNKWLEENFSERRAKKLADQVEQEVHVRGNSLWAVQSALTNWATHQTVEPALRRSGTDPVASTMLARETTVARLLEQPEFMALAA
jgi:hypothetical protein